MLTLNDKECTIEHVSQHNEFKGDDMELVVDMKISTQGSPALVDQMVPGFSDHFFEPASSITKEMGGPLQKRFPTFDEPYKFDIKIPGYRLAIVQQVSGMSVFENKNVTFTNVRVDLVDGGAVTVTFTAQCHGDIDRMKDAFPLMGKKLPITLLPPESEPLSPDHPDHPDNVARAAKAAAKKAKAEAKGTAFEGGKNPDAPATAALAGMDADAHAAATGKPAAPAEPNNAKATRIANAAISKAKH